MRLMIMNVNSTNKLFILIEDDGPTYYFKRIYIHIYFNIIGLILKLIN